MEQTYRAPMITTYQQFHGRACELSATQSPDRPNRSKFIPFITRSTWRSEYEVRHWQSENEHKVAGEHVEEDEKDSPLQEISDEELKKYMPHSMNSAHVQSAPNMLLWCPQLDTCEAEAKQKKQTARTSPTHKDDNVDHRNSDKGAAPVPQPVVLSIEPMTVPPLVTVNGKLTNITAPFGGNKKFKLSTTTQKHDHKQ